jgi:hypothetical protein
MPCFKAVFAIYWPLKEADMAAITINLPDTIARYVAEQGLDAPAWIETLVLDKVTALRSAVQRRETAPPSAPKPASPAPVPWVRTEKQERVLQEMLKGAEARRQNDGLTEEERRRRQKEASERLCGCCKGDEPPGAVERFLAERRKDKERELAIEERQRKESAYYAAKKRIPS